MVSAGALGRRSRVRYRISESYINLYTMTSKEGAGAPDHTSLEGGGPATQALCLKILLLTEWMQTPLIYSLDLNGAMHLRDPSTDPAMTPSLVIAAIHIVCLTQLGQRKHQFRVSRGSGIQSYEDDCLALLQSSVRRLSVNLGPCWPVGSFP